MKPRFRLFLASLTLALTCLMPTQGVFASPFISEIYLPSWGSVGIEISGLGDAGATLLVVDAADGANLRVRQSHFIPHTTGLNNVAVIGEAGWDELPATAGLSLNFVPITQDSLPITGHAALLLFEGVSPANQGTRLGQPSLVSGLFDANPIIDWVDLSPAASSEAVTDGRTTISSELEAALGIEDLDRPIAFTDGPTTLARPNLDGSPRLDLLLPGSATVIDTAGHQLLEFSVSPGILNPQTQELLDPPNIPEPGVAAAMIALLWPMHGRRRRSRHVSQE